MTPDRIWIDWREANAKWLAFEEPPSTEFGLGQDGYVRADLYEALKTANAAMKEANLELVERIKELEKERDNLKEIVKASQWVLQPFSDKVFNDNGDCTVSNIHELSAQRFIDAHFAYKRIRAAMTADRDQWKKAAQDGGK